MKQILFLSALGAGLLILAGCGRSSSVKTADEARQEVQAALAAVQKTSVAASYEAVGTIRSKASSTIQSKATGHVTAVNVREGDRVKLGQVLVELDAREAAAQLQRAQSALREAQAMRHEVETAVQAAVHAKSAADAGGDLAQTTYERYKNLTDQGAVSRQAFDEANARWKGASADAAQAGAMVASARARQGEADARIQQAEAALADAQTFVTYTLITAPFDGVVTRKSVDVGNLAAPGTPLLEVEDTQGYRLEAQVEESLLRDIKQGDAVPVVLEAIGPDELQGKVAEVVPTADPSSRTFVVKIDLPGNASVKSGMFGRARFSRGQTDLLTVPASAIVQRGQLTYVYVVGQDNVARLRLITTGKQYENRTEALSGVEDGERVVEAPNAQVTDGCRINRNSPL